jgi:tripeptide aminopeptidase
VSDRRIDALTRQPLRATFHLWGRDRATRWTSSAAGSSATRPSRLPAVTPAPFTSALAEELAPGLLERFQRYVRVDTQSQRHRTQSPSTPGQLELARMLVAELREIGLGDAALDDNGYVFATLPASAGAEGAPVIGLLAHVDTSPDAPGAGVEPLVHRDYDGGPIALPRGGTVLDPAAMPVLGAKLGHDIVTSSGDTLLGADDKAGMAEIMAAVAHLAAHPELPRPTLRIGFTPDEEIGAGAELFDVEAFGALCAYTLDGAQPGELQDETFSGKEVTVTVRGVEVHPGWAKGTLVNAARLAAQILARLPADTLTPETTEGREGFIHPYELRGTAGEAVIAAIVRDFDDVLLAGHVDLLRRTAEEVVATAPGATVEVAVVDQYPNMRRFLTAVPEAVEHAERALRAEGIEPVREPIRGGTDGSMLSAAGLPTPNLFTGGHEYHSVREWASVQDMASAAATVIRLAGEWAKG